MNGPEIPPLRCGNLQSNITQPGSRIAVAPVGGSRRKTPIVAGAAATERPTRRRKSRLPLPPERATIFFAAVLLSARGNEKGGKNGERLRERLRESFFVLNKPGSEELLRALGFEFQF